MQDLLSIMRSPDYVGYVGQLVGYDARDTGRLQTLEEAFADFPCRPPVRPRGLARTRRIAAGRAARAGLARASAARPADLGHGPLQLPLHLLHAARSVRQQLHLHAAFGLAVV
ncbi:hypothetical protein G6F57_021835 [Rhizopus arrhizus]|nr:hypothetical protein G6F57_021835 [Rhizopus arrhizus]